MLFLVFGICVLSLVVFESLLRWHYNLVLARKVIIYTENKTEPWGINLVLMKTYSSLKIGIDIYP